MRAVSPQQQPRAMCGYFTEIKISLSLILNELFDFIRTESNKAAAPTRHFVVTRGWWKPCCPVQKAACLEKAQLEPSGALARRLVPSPEGALGLQSCPWRPHRRAAAARERRCLPHPSACPSPPRHQSREEEVKGPARHPPHPRPLGSLLWLSALCAPVWDLWPFEIFFFSFQFTLLKRTIQHTSVKK